LRLTPPQPGRTIGIVWRQTSPRKADFIALGQLVTEALGLALKSAQRLRHKA
jgi:LysR family hydrogen peroxide-inducible transcriptional activator